jgi:hypothetical protein
MALVGNNSGMDSSTSNQESSVLTNEVAQNLCQQLCQLWLNGGLSANKAASLFNIAPALKNLLQPIRSDTESDVSAFCLTIPLLNAFNQLSQFGEWQLTLFGLNPEVREHWLNLAAARCHEAGAMSDPPVLVKLIQQLGDASEWVLAQLEKPDANPQIVAGPLAQTERELLGHSLNDNAAIPALCRILRACFSLDAVTNESKNKAIGPITAVDLTDKALAANWCSRRLLALPKELLNEQTPALQPQASWLLTERALKITDSSYNELFSHRPWLFFLSLLVFVQDAWAAERRGGFLLSLPSNQNAFAPTEISVAVQGIDGDEVRIGSLAEFLLQILTELNIALYPQPPAISTLNRALSSLVAELLSQQIWQFKDGGRGDLGQYLIHSKFGDACYRLPLNPLFGYKSAHLQHVIKHCAQTARAAKAVTIQGRSL